MTVSDKPSHDDVRAAFDEGDLLRARELHQQISPDSLSEESRSEYERLSKLLRPDPAAILIAVILGASLFAITIALFV
jgi:hypothetical protein